MSDSGLSVGELLDMPKGTDVLAGLPEEELKSIQSAARGMGWNSIKSAVGESLSQALDIDAVSVFAAAWEKYSLLSDAAKQSASGGFVLVHLAEHPVKATLHPYVEIQVGPITRKIEFDVTLSLKLKGVDVKVDSAEIRGIQAGTCEGSAEIGLASHSIWKHDIKPITLPGKVTLKSGVPIR